MDHQEQAKDSLPVHLHPAAEATAKAFATSAFYTHKGADCLSNWVGKVEHQLRLLFEDLGTSMIIFTHRASLLTRPYHTSLILTTDPQPFTNDFPRADIHELLSPDILHQLIKGSFKDHLQANQILADIDRRISATPSFPGLRRFPQGRGFKQWTGDDSKALMKVYLPALSGHVPSRMVQAIRAFLEFCYLTRRNVHDEATLRDLENALKRFHAFRTIFQETGVRPEGFSLPRQHALTHYHTHIRLFGAPNGLCSSITESKHIKAVKEPWRRSNHFEAIMQMMVTNQRLDQLSAMRVDYMSRGMLDSSQDPATQAPLSQRGHEHHGVRSTSPTPPQEKSQEPVPGVSVSERDDDGDVDGPSVLGYVRLAKKPAQGYPRDVQALGNQIECQELQELICRFLHSVSHSENADIVLPLEECPQFSGLIQVYHSAVAVYSDSKNPFYAGHFCTKH
ncbi:hypothetical protein PTI98_010760 [Pleurotus ostreatus]|nr:hypothetical protein PTI98_010760 [Pleurotus ostreatus]